jgi:hypothetical protein
LFKLFPVPVMLYHSLSSAVVCVSLAPQLPHLQHTYNTHTPLATPPAT